MMRRVAVLVLGLSLALAACAGEPPPAPPPAVAAVAVEGVPEVALSDARLAVAEALTEARLTRAALLQEAMALPPDNPRRPALADRAERLKRLEDDLVAVQRDLQAARAPDTPAEVAERSVRQAQAAATRLRALTGRLGQ